VTRREKKPMHTVTAEKLNQAGGRNSCVGSTASGA
jgi:hypothetical protein